MVALFSALFNGFAGGHGPESFIPGYIWAVWDATRYALTVTGTLTIVFVNDTFTEVWGAGDIGPVPTMVVWTAIVFVVTYFLYSHTIFGRYVQATGGNLMAARFSGINTNRIKLTTLTMSGLASGLGGLLMTARLYSGRPYIGQGLEMDVIAAVILGGTSLFGGKGTIIGPLVGALSIAEINNGLCLVSGRTCR